MGSLREVNLTAALRRDDAHKGEDNMERMAWKGRIKSGCKAEYIRRHDEIWPEMKALLKQAGLASL